MGHFRPSLRTRLLSGVRIAPKATGATGLDQHATPDAPGAAQARPTGKVERPVGPSCGPALARGPLLPAARREGVTRSRKALGFGLRQSLYVNTRGDLRRGRTPVALVMSQATGTIVGSARPLRSKHLEIFAVLPVGHFRLEALDLGVLDMHVIVDELRTERVAEERVLL